MIPLSMSAKIYGLMGGFRAECVKCGAYATTYEAHDALIQLYRQPDYRFPATAQCGEHDDHLQTLPHLDVSSPHAGFQQDMLEAHSQKPAIDWKQRIQQIDLVDLLILGLLLTLISETIWIVKWCVLFFRG